MSVTPYISRKMPHHIHAQKGETPIVCLTAYTASFTRVIDEQCDLLIVGDSLGMVLYGHDNTLEVSLDMMVAHGRAVVKASQASCVVVDMPFGTYQQSPEHAFENAAILMAKTGAQAVKIEGGETMADTIAFLTQRGIPVMGHVGLMPQYANMLGGFRYQGRSDAERRQILADSQAVEQAGAFSMVLEAVEHSLASEVTQSVSMPVIGIGASEACDGQVLVTEDMVGLTERAPKFVKQFANLQEPLSNAAAHYANAVRNRSFPAAENQYGKKKTS